jgi:hypothetical protein
MFYVKDLKDEVSKILFERIWGTISL